MKMVAVARLFIYVFILHLSISSVAARDSKHSIKGFIYNVNTSNPIPFSNITLINSVDSCFVCGTTTDTNGVFTMNSPIDKGILKVSVIGYETETLITNFRLQNDTLKIALTPLNINLAEVVIKGDLASISMLEDKLIFTPPKELITNGDRGFDLLKLTPMVFVDYNGKVLVENRAATIMVNGIEIPSNQYSSYIKNLKARDVKSIEVQTISSPELDASIEGGVVNIITKTQQIGINIGIESSDNYKNSTSYNQNTGARIDYGSRNWRMYGSYFFYSGKETWTADDNTVKYDFFNNNRVISETSGGTAYPRVHNYQLGGVLDLKKHTIGVEFSGRNTRPQKTVSMGKIVIEDIDKERLDNGISQFSIEPLGDLYNTSFHYTYKLDSLNSKLKCMGSYVSYKSNRINDSNSNYQINPENNVNERNISGSETTNKFAQIDLIKNTKMEYSFRAGFKYSTTDRNSSLGSYTLSSDRWMENGNDAMDAYKEDIIAAYLSLKKTFGKLSLKAGVRSETTHLSGKMLRDDYNDKIVRNEHELFPHFYGRYSFSKSKSLSLSYSKTIYRPSFNLLSSYATRVSDFMYDVGNPNLRPQISNRVELKYKLNKHFVTVYMRQIPNLFAESWEVKNSIIYHSNANNGEALYTGLRYSYSGKITNSWFLNWSSVGYYSHIPQSHYKKEYFSLVLSANNRFKISSKSTINFSGQYRSSSIATNTYTIGHYLVDASFEHSFLQGALDIRLSFTDIFNTVKQESYIKTPQFNYDFHQKLATRGVMLRVSYNISSQKKILNKKNNNKNDIINRL